MKLKWDRFIRGVALGVLRLASKEYRNGLVTVRILGERELERRKNEDIRRARSEVQPDS